MAHRTEPVLNMRSHVQHRFAGENISVKPHRQRHRPREHDRNNSITPMKRNSSKNQRIYPFIGLHFYAENVLGQSQHAIVTHRPIKAHHQKNRGHRHRQVRIGSRRTEQRACHIFDGERHHAVLVGRPVTDAADARNQIHIIGHDDENEKRRRKRKNPSRDRSDPKYRPSNFPSLRRSSPCKFCIPDGISLIFFQVVTRTTIKMTAATIHEQTIELETGSEICFGHQLAKIEGTPSSRDGPI